MSTTTFSQRLSANDLAGILWLPLIVFSIYGAGRLALYLVPTLPAISLSLAFYGGFLLSFAAAIVMSAFGKIWDARLFRSLNDSALSGAERLQLAERSPTVLVALAAWPVAASLTAIVLGGYFDAALLFVILWAVIPSILFPNCLGRGEPSRS